VCVCSVMIDGWIGSEGCVGGLGVRTLLSDHVMWW
jgi:hypothetical protein